jgi:opacity protein-like surface antigen
MSNFKKFALASAAAMLAVTAANAADLLPPPPPPVPVVGISSWYLRGDVGMTNQKTTSLTDFVPPAVSVGNKFLTFDSAPLLSAGAGYQFTNWLRFDVTGEYRGNAHFHGQQVAGFPGGSVPDDYSASKSEWLFLANAYVDLGTWWCITPFIGAGVGTARVNISSFVDTNVSALSTAYGEDAAKWNLAWAAYAGLAYKVAPGLNLELTYRYLNLGTARTGLTNTFDGVTLVNGPPFNFGTITSQDVMLGFRWNLPVALPEAPPIISKG